MSFDTELPERPEPRGAAGWLRLGAVVAGVLATWIAALCLRGPLDALGAACRLPHWLPLGRLATAATYSGIPLIVREWSRPARRFLAAHGLQSGR